MTAPSRSTPSRARAVPSSTPSAVGRTQRPASSSISPSFSTSSPWTRSTSRDSTSTTHPWPSHANAVMARSASRRSPSLPTSPSAVPTTQRTASRLSTDGDATDPPGRCGDHRHARKEELVAPDGRRIPMDEPTHLPPIQPSKIVCVHLNYESRRAEFLAELGPAPTFFHKPTTSLNAHGGEVVRPARCRYLNYEGEIAIVMGERCTSLPMRPTSTSRATPSRTTTASTTSATPTPARCSA